ncbi:MAG: hypothetical protein JJ975_04130 [Bacteroidia bacterium]|nr:hypothetical protein [Bacteroidia bacterium]
MKQFFYTLVFLLFAGPLVGQTQLDWSSHGQDNYGIKAPAEWTFDNSGLMGTKFLLMSPLVDSTDDFSENINLIVQDVSESSLSVEQFALFSLELVKKMVNDVEVVKSELEKNDGMEHYHVEYTGQQGEYKLHWVQYLYLNEGKAYILTGVARQETSDQYVGILNKIMSTFSFK